MFKIMTPFGRIENKEAFIDHVRKLGVDWYPIINSDISFPDEPWIHPFRTEIGKMGTHPCFECLNNFWASGTLVDDDYYVTLNDDDFLEEGFFDKLKHCTKDIIIVSMKRGMKPVPGNGQHGISTLYARPEETKGGSMGGEQLIMKGKVCKNIAHKDDGCADGVLIEQLYKQMPEQFEYVPDAYVLFNFLQKGRWE